ncbi:hypothetical protein GHT06_012973 [Daphnia sinensis]|uniref:Uncharacterized protein n=1 Tax=Daphnia sinensis TaxID=1820382 RepID=A0AAD5KWJ6_9CRUS|nr:hypothetical protein GHT06_012973 [Daphnia sinensis]
MHKTCSCCVAVVGVLDTGEYEFFPTPPIDSHWTFFFSPDERKQNQNSSEQEMKNRNASGWLRSYFFPPCLEVILSTSALFDVFFFVREDWEGAFDASAARKYQTLHLHVEKKKNLVFHLKYK